MNVLILLAHPHPGSLNHAIAETAKAIIERQGHEAVLHDLYLEEFPALLPADEIPTDGPVDLVVLDHCRDLSQADGIVVVHPNWWGMPPAVLKGWIDRVIRPEVAYRFLEGDEGEGVPQGLLKAQWALVFNTANTGAQREFDVFGDPLETIWQKCIFGLCGVDDFTRRTYSVVVTSSGEQRKDWLAEVEELVSSKLDQF